MFQVFALESLEIFAIFLKTHEVSEGSREPHAILLSILYH